MSNEYKTMTNAVRRMMVISDKDLVRGRSEMGFVPVISGVSIIMAVTRLLKEDDILQVCIHEYSDDRDDIGKKLVEFDSITSQEYVHEESSLKRLFHEAKGKCLTIKYGKKYEAVIHYSGDPDSILPWGPDPICPIIEELNMN